MTLFQIRSELSCCVLPSKALFVCASDCSSRKKLVFKIANHTVDQGALFCCQIYCISVVFCARARQNLKSFWQRRKTVWFVVNCHRRITVQGSLVVFFYRLYWRGYWETFIIYYIFLLTIFLHIMNQTRDKSSVKQTRTPNRGPCSCCVLNISLKYLVFDILLAFTWQTAIFKKKAKAFNERMKYRRSSLSNIVHPLAKNEAGF